MSAWFLDSELSTCFIEYVITNLLEYIICDSHTVWIMTTVLDSGIFVWGMFGKIGE